MSRKVLSDSPEQTETGRSNHQKLEAAAQNAILQLASRWGILAICAVALPIGGWIGNRAVATLDRVDEKVGILSTDVAVMKNDISYLKTKVQP